jgi:hypothetical protein
MVLAIAAFVFHMTPALASEPVESTTLRHEHLCAESSRNVLEYSECSHPAGGVR